DCLHVRARFGARRGRRRDGGAGHSAHRSAHGPDDGPEGVCRRCARRHRQYSRRHARWHADRVDGDLAGRDGLFDLPRCGGVCRAGFMAVGGYTATYLTVYHGRQIAALAGSTVTDPVGSSVVMVPSLAAGALAAAMAGLLVGIPSLRLKGDYLAIVTLGFGEII